VPRKARLSIALGVLGALCLLVADLSTYADRALFDSKSFADRATSTLDDQDVRNEIGERVTDTLIKAAPNLLATRPILQATASGAVASAPFQSLFRDSVEDVHRSLFQRDRDTTVLKVVDAGVLVDSALQQFAPAVAERIPEDVQVKLVKFSDDGPDAIGTDLAQQAENNKRRAFVAWVATVLFFAFAILIAPDRRRGVWRVGIAIAVVGALVVAAYYLGRTRVIGYGDGDQATGAVRAIWGAFFLDARNWNLFLAGGGLVLAAASAGALRPVSIAPALERARALAITIPNEPWQRGVRAATLVLVGGFILIARDAAIQIAAFLVGAGLLYVGVTELMRLILPPAVERKEKPAATVRRGRRRMPVRALAAVLCAFAVVGVGAVALAATNKEEQPPFEITACNGSASLCDRPLDAVVFPSTHNSMSAATEPGWLFANQNDGVPAQLRAGIRGLLIDTHYGIKTKHGVYTVLPPGSKSREKLAGPLGEQGIAAVNRIRKRIGYRGGGKKEIFWCHAFCELGATGGVALLKEVSDFLATHPYEVLMISVEDDASPEDTAKLFEKSGLINYVYRGPLRPMPTMRDLIQSGERVVVMGEDDVGRVPWFRQQFDFVQETPYRFADLPELVRPPSCDLERGKRGNPLFLLNHWIDTSPAPRVTLARKANSRRVLLARARRCQKVRKLLPNLVAVDLYREGDVFGIVRTLNRR
jgi:hypothetical protein